MIGTLAAAMATGLATALGALPFLWLSVSRRLYDTMLGLGAGLMLAAATLGLLGGALARVHDEAGALDLSTLGAVLAGFLTGVVILYFMDRLIPHAHAQGHHHHVGQPHEHHHHGHDHQHEHDHASDEHEHGMARKQGLMVVGVMTLHRLPEGFAIGAAWAAGGHALGLTLAVAIGVQNAVEGAVMAAPLKKGGMRAPALLALVAATGMVVPVAAVCGNLLSSRVAGALPPMLALGGGALIYLTCNEIIPESHSHGNEVRATWGIIAGFLLIMILNVVFGHHD